MIKKSTHVILIVSKLDTAGKCHGIMIMELREHQKEMLYVEIKLF